MAKFKNTTNLLYPYFPQLRHRQILQVVTGDHHTLILVAGPLGQEGSTEVFGLG